MQPPRRFAVVAVTVFAVVVGAPWVGPHAARGDVADPDFTYEAWFARAKTPPPRVDVPTQGPVSPGPGFPPAPQAPDGAFVVSSFGGDSGGADGHDGSGVDRPGGGTQPPEGADSGWAAWAWDTFAAADGTAEQFVATFTVAPDSRADFGDPVVQACNIVEPWAGAPRANSWEERPMPDCSDAVAPTVEVLDEGGPAERTTYTFDLTPFAQSWIDGTGSGVVLVPGTPEHDERLEPFQLTFSGYTNETDAPERYRPQVTFRFTPAPVPDFDTGLAGPATGRPAPTAPTARPEPSVGVDRGGTGLAPAPDVDPIPDDVGSPSSTAPSPRTAAPAASSREAPGPPWAAALLVPLALAGAWAVGRALGPAGEPVLPRQGGVSRVLERRRGVADGAAAEGAA